ncbi:MAG: site-specific DNA-methyltransferase [Saprospiraceae bacterium]|nr:site-specific DNA-methyltransferase [Saprospiraceae bacterium]
MRSFYESIGVNPRNRKEAIEISKLLEIPIVMLDFYNEHQILPFENHLTIINERLHISEISLKIRMGIIDSDVRDLLLHNEDYLLKQYAQKYNKVESLLTPSFQTELGKLFQGDCLDLLKQTGSETYDLIFADPPFNLDKFYLSNYDDNISSIEYLNWCYEWINECVRVLKTGGSLFIWNIPKWNTFFSNYLNNKLLFRHWISVDIKFSLPIGGKLYPSHYSLLYYSKGKPTTFRPDRMPMEVCKKCFTDLKDYGGYKNKMNSNGVNLTDVWYDIPPVRHNKYKRRKEANELNIKLLDRIIEMSSKEEDLIFDPFGGAGTTYIAAEIKNRRWHGIELGPLDDIIKRFENIEEDKELLRKYRRNYNSLFPIEIKNKRMQLNLWTDESFNEVEVKHSPL